MTEIVIQTQQQLDTALDRTHTLQVINSQAGPLPIDNTAYHAVRALVRTGFSFTPRELLHAIACKTAALPISMHDKCLTIAWLYTYILDLEGPYLAFRGDYGSDLQIARSQEIGIGILCLIAERCFGIPWVQLGSLPGQGKRFDYRGTTASLRCIFEAKGTSYRGNQASQIESGLQKKAAHHARGEYFDVELIISSCIERNQHPPRIVLADPNESSLKQLYERGDNRYFQLKHYCRVLQYIGLPRSAYYLNRFAREYLDNRKAVYKPTFNIEGEREYLNSITIEGDEFLGQWFNTWLPEGSKRYKHLYLWSFESRISLPDRRRSVFQGVRRDIYKSGLLPIPFSNPPLEEEERLKYRRFNQRGVSVFPDGTVMVFKQD